MYFCAWLVRCRFFLCVFATLRNATCHVGCALAMPLPEGVRQRFDKLLAAAEGDGFEAEIIAAHFDSPLKLWRQNPPPLTMMWQLVRQWEKEGSPTPPDLERLGTLGRPPAYNVDRMQEWGQC